MIWATDFPGYKSQQLGLINEITYESDLYKEKEKKK